MVRHPYYITAPGFSEHSSGIRVLHYLCHVLNLLGYEAYISASQVSQWLWTPLLSDEVMKRHFITGRKPIALYPEVVRGTPLGVGTKVRLLLNLPGKIAGHAEFDDDEITFGYRSAFVKDPATPLLTMPTSDPAQFCPGLPESQRSGRYVFFNRLLARGGKLQAVTADAEEISSRKPRSMAELSEIFKRAELLYCYEDGAITLEARMCGCPVVFIPNGTMLPTLPSEDFGGLGAAWGTSEEEIRRAKDTVSQVYPAALKLYEKFDEQLGHFIETTQRAADNQPMERCYPMATVLARGWLDTPETHAAKRQSIQRAVQYRQWLQREQLKESDAVLLAERLVREKQEMPEMHLLMPVQGTDCALINQSLDSLNKQLYSNWKATVVSDQLPPAQWKDHPRVQWLSLKDAIHINYVVDEMAAASSSGWVARFEPGVTLAPQALLLMADLVQRHPDWCLVYADEDTVQADGSHVDPRFKPGFDQELLRACNYLGHLIMVRKDAFLDVGRYGAHGGAHNYDLALRMADRLGPTVFGHLARVVVHVAAQAHKPASASIAAEAAALADHLARHGLRATARVGLQAGTRHLEYHVGPPPKVSVAILVKDELPQLRKRLEELQELPVEEVLIMDIDTNDPDVHDFVKQQVSSEPWRGRLHLLQASYSNWPQSVASLAKGDLLYLAGIHTTGPTAEDWKELVSILLGSDSAAVAPRVVSSVGSRPVVLNAGYTPLTKTDAHAFLPASQDPGQLNEHLCTHGILAVSQLPLLLRKDVFLAMNGFRLNEFTFSDAVTDFCCRLRQAGLALIWTPHVTLEQQSTEPSIGAVDVADPTGDSHRKLLSIHISSLCANAFAHPLISLDRPGQFEHQIPLAWTQTPSEKPRMLLVITDGEPAKDTGFYAAVNRWQQSAQGQFVLADMRTQTLSALTAGKLMPDAVVIHASCATSTKRLLDDLALCLPQISRVVRIDALDFLPPGMRENANDSRPILRKLLRHATKVIVPTQELAVLCSGLVDQILVHQSLEALSASEWLGYSFDGHRSGSTSSEPTTMS